MIITDIIWKEYFVEKLARKHHVVTEEAEKVLSSKPLIRKVSLGHYRGEDVYAAFGQALNGRYLIIFFIDKKRGLALPISARDMDKAERRYYERQKKEKR